MTEVIIQGDFTMAGHTPEWSTPPSPFLPNTFIQYAWDSTSLGWLKTCPRLYQYNMIEGYTTHEENVHLRFGIEYHQALHDYEKSINAGLDHEEAVHDTLRALLGRVYDWNPSPNPDKRSEMVKSKANLARTVLWYLDKHKDDNCKTYITAESMPAMELSFKFELDWGPDFGMDVDLEINQVATQPYLLCGHLDRVVNFNDDLFVMDRKTTASTIGPYWFNQWNPNNQMTLYILASQIILQTPIKGLIIDGAQIAGEFTRFQRGFTHRTQEQVDEWLGDLKFLLAQAEDYAAEGYWPMNDTSCDKYGGCRFREVCSKSPQVRDSFLKSNFLKREPWNPLVERT